MSSKGIPLANPNRGPFGRNLGKLEHAVKANPGRQTPRAEFADGISCYSRPNSVESNLRCRRHSKAHGFRDFLRGEKLSTGSNFLSTVLGGVQAFDHRRPAIQRTTPVLACQQARVLP